MIIINITWALAVAKNYRRQDRRISPGVRIITMIILLCYNIFKNVFYTRARDLLFAAVWVQRAYGVSVGAETDRISRRLNRSDDNRNAVINTRDARVYVNFSDEFVSAWTVPRGFRTRDGGETSRAKTVQYHYNNSLRTARPLDSRSNDSRRENIIISFGYDVCHRSGPYSCKDTQMRR